MVMSNLDNPTCCKTVLAIDWTIVGANTYAVMGISLMIAFWVIFQQKRFVSSQTVLLLKNVLEYCNRCVSIGIFLINLLSCRY